jgi:hypothetical protein
MALIFSTENLFYGGSSLSLPVSVKFQYSCHSDMFFNISLNSQKATS